MRTATTTLTRTNWAINTKMTKKMGAMICDTQQFLMQCSEWSQFSRSVSFMMPFQLSPVATRNSVKKAMILKNLAVFTQEGDAEVLEVGVLTQTLTRMLVVAFCKHKV